MRHDEGLYRFSHEQLLYALAMPAIPSHATLLSAAFRKCLFLRVLANWMFLLATVMLLVPLVTMWISTVAFSFLHGSGGILDMSVK